MKLQFLATLEVKGDKVDMVKLITGLEDKLSESYKVKEILYVGKSTEEDDK